MLKTFPRVFFLYLPLVARSLEACLGVCLPRGTPDGPVVARKFDSMDLRLSHPGMPRQATALPVDT